jgi:hypothetical protein
MTKRNWFLIFIALALAGAYAFYFTNWFTPQTIHITSISRNIRERRANPAFSGKPANGHAADDSAVVPIFFKLGRPCKLTELKVVNLAEWQANKNCLPLWHLVAGTNSVLITEPFLYGDYIPGSGIRPEYYIPGMKPEVPGALAQPLQPGVKYRLFVTDGYLKGQHDFQPVAKPTTPASQ